MKTFLLYKWFYYIFDIILYCNFVLKILFLYKKKNQKHPRKLFIRTIFVSNFFTQLTIFIIYNHLLYICNLFLYLKTQSNSSCYFILFLNTLKYFYLLAIQFNLLSLQDIFKQLNLFRKKYLLYLVSSNLNLNF